MDTHHAAASGQYFETNFSDFLSEQLNLTVLKTKKSFTTHGVLHLYQTLKKIAHPEGWCDDPNRKKGKRGSESDGIILEFKLAFEHKGAYKFGTTEQKIWWEFIKLMLGITPNRYLFVFDGILENEFHATHFMQLIDQFRKDGNKNFTHVHCVRQSELTREWLEERFASTIPADVKPTELW